MKYWDDATQEAEAERDALQVAYRIVRKMLKDEYPENESLIGIVSTWGPRLTEQEEKAITEAEQLV